MTEATPAKTDSSFKTRMKSALIFGPAVLVVIGFGGGAFHLMMAAAAAVAANEWCKMVLVEQKTPPYLIKLVTFLTGLSALSAAMVLTPVTSLWFLLSLCFLIFAYNYSQHGGSLKNVFIGILYIGFSIDIMVWIRAGSSTQGLYHFVTLLCIVWGSDVFAYLTGRAIGGPKLAPSISPKKTWAGFIGSSLGAGALAAILALPAVTGWLGVKTIGGLESVGYFVLAAILAMFGQAGDLLISIFKRHYGVKDTGTLIPGHGGLLDRIDALLLVAYIFGMIIFVTR